MEQHRITSHHVAGGQCRPADHARIIHTSLDGQDEACTLWAETKGRVGRDVRKVKVGL